MTITNFILEPYQLNEKISLKNRIIMAPMTRSMANDDLSPAKEMAAYYARRAAAGLIITEGTIIRPDARGSSNAPGIFTQSHIDGWKQVSDAVHQNNGLIFSQLWHVGRVSRPDFLNGELPISASETILTTRVHRATGLYYGKSRALTLAEIKILIEDYAIAAQNAIKAGFDGIEIHGANGYLIDQFLHYHTNHRTDDYGATPVKMARFALEIVRACGDSIGYHKVGIRLSPGGYLHQIVGQQQDAAVFQYLLEQLSLLPIAYVHTGNSNDKVRFKELDNKTMTEFMRAHYTGPLLACGGYAYDQAQTKISAKDFDLIAMGRPFIANPDLIERFNESKTIQPYQVTMLNTLL